MLHCHCCRYCWGVYDLRWPHAVSFIAIVRDVHGTTLVGGLTAVTVIVTIEGWGVRVWLWFSSAMTQHLQTM